MAKIKVMVVLILLAVGCEESHKNPDLDSSLLRDGDLIELVYVPVRTPCETNPQGYTQKDFIRICKVDTTNITIDTNDTNVPGKWFFVSYENRNEPNE